MHDEFYVYEQVCYLHMYGSCLTHDGLRSEVCEGWAVIGFILTQLQYEHVNDARERSGDYHIASGLQTSTKLRLSYQGLRFTSPEAAGREHRSYFCLPHLVLRVVRRVEESFPSDALASTPPIFAVCVRFRGDILDRSSESSALRFLLAGIELFVLLASGCLVVRGLYVVFFVGVPSLFFGDGSSSPWWLGSSSIFLFFPAIVVFLTSLLEVLPPEISSESDVCGVLPFTTGCLCSGIDGKTLLLDGRPAAFSSVVGGGVVLW